MHAILNRCLIGVVFGEGSSFPLFYLLRLTLEREEVLDVVVSRSQPDQN